MQKRVEEPSEVVDVPPYAASVVVDAELQGTATESSVVAQTVGLLLVVVLAYVAIMRRPGVSD